MNILPSIEQYFKEQNVEVVLFPSTRTKRFLKIKTFIDFFQKEYDFWSDCRDGTIVQIREQFHEIKNCLDNIQNSSDENKIKSDLELAINKAKMNRFPCVYSETKEGKFLKEVYIISYIQASAACDYIFKNAIPYPNQFNYDTFLGVMRAYNQEDRDKISEKTVEVEKQLLLELHDKFHNQLQELSSEFFSRSEEITKEFDTLKQNFKEGQDQFTNDTDTLLEKSKHEIKEFETLYREKLQLEAPAKYWEELHTHYITGGEKWIKWILWTSGIFILFLAAVLYNLPQDFVGQFGFNSIKTTIVIALIASVGVYVIRFFVMLSTSAYHLARDAQERYQLTYVYLSLLKEEGVSESERSIVLQSIFSRADTGLLKRDSSPAFPGMLQQIIKNLKK